MKKKVINSLVKEAMSYGLKVKSVDNNVTSVDLVLDDNFDLHVAHAFASKYSGNLNGSVIPYIHIPDGGLLKDPAIMKYHDAYIALRFAEQNLNEAIQPEYTKLLKKKDIPGIQDMIGLLPKNFPGVRRMYEAILRLEEEK